MFGLNDFRTKNKMGCIYDKQSWHVPIKTKAYGTVHCGVVSCYKYLGLVTQQKGFNLDTAAKVKKTKSAVGELYGCLFKSKYTSIKHHKYYADVLLASKLFSCAGTWHNLLTKSVKALEKSYYSVLRCAVRSQSGCTYVSNADIVSKYKYPSLNSKLVVYRLRLYARVVQHASPMLRQLIASSKLDSSSWQHQICIDLELLRENCGELLESMPAVTADPYAWYQLVHNFPSQFKKYLKLFADTKQGSFDSLISTPPPPDEDVLITCPHCDKRFVPHAMKTHLFSKHGIKKPYKV